MPLDVQPLSPRRQAIRAVIMLGLLLSALGFAKLFVNKQHDLPRLIPHFAPSPGNKDALFINRALDETIAQTFSVDGRIREYAAYFARDSLETFQRSWRDSLSDGPSVMHISPVAENELAGLKAEQFEVLIQEPQRPTFAILRAAARGDRVLAISFRGIGPITDADRQDFEDYCARGVTFIEAPRRP